jgi:putative transposase
MKPLSFKRHRFPPEIIRYAIWLYARFTLSFRDVEELLAERGVDASYETVRRWFLKFGLSNRSEHPALKAAAQRPLAPRRDGDLDPRRPLLALAGRRQ